MKCLNCNKETNNPKYCCKSCSTSHTNRLNPKRKCTRICRRCNEKVMSCKHSMCGKHTEEYLETTFDKLKDIPLKDYWNRNSLKNLHKSSKNVHIRHFGRSRFKDLISLPCANCGYDKHVELCHIKPIKDFNENSTIGEVNSRSNLIQLCRNCHWEFDHNLLDLSSLLDSNQ